MIVFLVVVSGASSLIALLAAWASDTWEREPLESVENVLLLGVAVQVALVLLARWAAGFDAWGALGLFGVALPAGILLPFAAAKLSELDEPYDGIVYSVAFASGSSLVLLLWDVPALAREAGGAALHPGAVLGLRDLVALLGAPAVLARLGAHAAAVAVAVLTGGLYGVLVGVRDRRRAPLALALAGGLLAALLSLADLLVQGAWWGRVGLAVLAVIAAFVLKSRSPFRSRPKAPRTDLAVEGVKAALIVIGACFVALCLLASVAGSDRFEFPRDGQEWLH